MPLTLRPISRRSFLAGAAAGGLALLTCNQWSFGQSVATDGNRFALLSDPHIAGDLARVSRDVNMADHLCEAVRQVLAPVAGKPPAHVVINGDCALTSGESADYATLLSLLSPLTTAAVPVTMALGNHDHRERFREATKLPSFDIGPAEAIDQRHVSVVRSPKVDLVILDTLDKTNVTPGVIGPTQLKWLTETLDRTGDKPTIVIMHHNLNRPDPAATQPAKFIGLVDTQPLLDLLLSRRNVKALLTGHLHTWAQSQIDGLHLVALPAVAYVFDAKQPSGWVDCLVDEGGAKLSLRCVKPGDERNGQTVDLRWRA